MQIEPRTGARKPVQETDAPLGGRQIANVVTDLAPMVAPYYATTADRDAAHVDWVTAGNTMRDGLVCRVGGIGLMQYVGGEWLTVANAEDVEATIAALQFPKIVGLTFGTVQYGHTGTSELQVGGGAGGSGNEIGTITGMALQSGRWYQARFRGRAWAGVASVQVGLRIRVGASLSVSSVAVATEQVDQPDVGPSGINDNDFDGDFAVQTTGTYQAGLYGVVASGSFAVGNDARNRHEVLIYDMGPSFPGLTTVTS